MKVRHISIERFRGIQKLDWNINGDFICLIGSGDSTKLTILDAIELTLYPYWNVGFDDTDFYNADISEPIKITVSIGGNLPQNFLSDAKYGLHARYWKENQISEEPSDDEEPVLSIQLVVDSTLDPTWTVINERIPEGKKISWKDREKIKTTRLGTMVDQHLSCSKGSVLLQLILKNKEVKSVLTEISREARKALDSEKQLPNLHDTVTKVENLGRKIGVTKTNKYLAKIDSQKINMHAGYVALHDGEIPLRRRGLGIRRLLAAILQNETKLDNGIALIDEIKHGLEPYRWCGNAR